VLLQIYRKGNAETWKYLLQVKEDRDSIFICLSQMLLGEKNRLIKVWRQDTTNKDI